MVTYWATQSKRPATGIVSLAWTKTSTAGECTSSRSRSATLSITAAVSGKPCNAVAISTRILARWRSSRESWFHPQSFKRGTQMRCEDADLSQ